MVFVYFVEIVGCRLYRNSIHSHPRSNGSHLRGFLGNGVERKSNIKLKQTKSILHLIIFIEQLYCNADEFGGKRSQ